MVLKAVLSVFLSITRRTMFFQLWVVLLRQRKSSCLDDSQSQLLSSVVNLLLGHQSHIFMHERRLVFIVGQGFISVLLAKNKYCYWSWFFTLCLEPSFLLFWGKWFSGLSERLQCFHSLHFSSCTWAVSEGFLCLLTLIYESLKNKKAPSLHNDPALCK